MVGAMDEAAYAIIGALRTVAAETKASPATVALAWVRSHGCVAERRAKRTEHASPNAEAVIEFRIF